MRRGEARKGKLTARSCVALREETDKEINVKARMPAWAKGKSVMLDLNNNNIRLALKEEEDKPIIEVSDKDKRRGQATFCSRGTQLLDTIEHWWLLLFLSIVLLFLLVS